MCLNAVLFSRAWSKFLQFLEPSLNGLYLKQHCVERERRKRGKSQVAKLCHLKARAILDCPGHLPSGQLEMMPSGCYSRVSEFKDWRIHSHCRTFAFSGTWLDVASLTVKSVYFECENECLCEVAGLYCKPCASQPYITVWIYLNWGYIKTRFLIRKTSCL